jgi:two-component system sensor histidine kinase and response regulator WspE
VSTEPDPFLLSLVAEELVRSAPVFAAFQKSPTDQANYALLLEAASSLKSAARVAGLAVLGDFAAAVESSVSPLLGGNHNLSSDSKDALNAAASLMEVLSAASPEALLSELERQQQELVRTTAALKRPEAGAPSAGISMAAETADTSLLELFRCETETAAKGIENGLIVLERAHSPETLEAVMRAAHSLKGAARLLGLDGVVKLAHAMEELLLHARRGVLVLGPANADALLAANDVFQEIARTSAEEIPAYLFSRADRIHSLTAQVEASAVNQEFELRPASDEKPSAHPQSSPVSPQAGQQSVRVAADTLSRIINRSGEVLVRTASLTAYRPVFRELARTAASMVNGTPNEEQGRFQPTLTDAHHLLQQLSELANDFDTRSIRLEEQTRRLYDTALSCRLQPFADAVEGLPRMVRDVARICGKEAQLTVAGESTLVDRDTLELLNTSLNHVVRNAIDHGLEPPEVRLRGGKPPIGAIRIEARHHAGMLEISVADDGAGIPREQLRRTIVSRGYVREEAAQSLSDSELLDFLFLPGFSIRTETTEISGRGVGLDSVQQMVRLSGGWIRVESVEGQGTVFRLWLPVAVSVSRCLLVEIADELYAVPLARIDRVLEVDAETRHCEVDHTPVSLTLGRHVLGFPPAEANADHLFAIIYIGDSQRYGILVEGLAGIHDIPVSPLPPALGKAPATNGAALMDDGRIVLVLDTDDLVNRVQHAIIGPEMLAVEQPFTKQPFTRAPNKRSVLLVDDSESVRAVLRRTLENDGYEVTTASDGTDALNLLAARSFDLLITDIDMPHLDGLTLVRRVRAQAATAPLPVIVASYRDSMETQEQALLSGANRFIAKASLRDDALIRSVRELLS